MSPHPTGTTLSPLLLRVPQSKTRWGMKSQSGETGEAVDFRALTTAIKRGDATAFSEFYDRYSLPLYKYLFVLARGDESQAKEVCQTLFIKLTKRFEVLNDEKSLWAWLRTVAKHEFIDHCRRQHKLERLVSLDEVETPTSTGANSVSLLNQALRDVLAEIPLEEAELLQEIYLDKRPIRELAEESHQSYEAIESRLARLRRKLKDRILKVLRHEDKT